MRAEDSSLGKVVVTEASGLSSEPQNPCESQIESPIHLPCKHSHREVEAGDRSRPGSPWASEPSIHSGE